jgi:hypothetical protein
MRSGGDLSPHPLLRGLAAQVWLTDPCQESAFSLLERERALAQACDGTPRPSFREQDESLLADGLHYEQRIGENGVVATRSRNAHDLFNALIWLRHAPLKWALNARQVADIAVVGPKQRTRAQYALTQFDEAGAIVWLADPALLPLWDAHDWPALFLRERDAWGPRIALTVFGHALFEHVWNGRALPVAKALVVCVDARSLVSRPADAAALLPGWPEAESDLATAIREARLLRDPQELRPLPLAGIPGWHGGHDSTTFVRDAPCFRPLRPGRCYPEPLHSGA